MPLSDGGEAQGVGVGDGVGVTVGEGVGLGGEAPVIVKLSVKVPGKPWPLTNSPLICVSETVSL